MANILLDTNAFSFFISGNKHIRTEIGKSDIVYLPIVVIGELYVGYEGGVQKDLNYKILEKFITDDKIKLLKASLETARIYGEIMVKLNKNGIPVPTNDVWIAAHAIETGSIVITYDKHFLKIPSVKVWKELK